MTTPFRHFETCLGTTPTAVPNTSSRQLSMIGAVVLASAAVLLLISPGFVMNEDGTRVDMMRIGMWCAIALGAYILLNITGVPF